MPTKPAIYALISVDDKGDPRVEEFDMFSALRVRMTNIQANDPQYKLLADGRPVSWDWGEPELHIHIGGDAPAVAEQPKKPRAKRRTPAEMAAARLAKQEARKPASPSNGTVAA